MIAAAARFALLFVVAFPTTSCAALHGDQSALDAAGPQAARIEALWWTYLLIATVVFTLVVITCVQATARAMGASDPHGDPPALDDTQPPPSRAMRKLLLLDARGERRFRTAVSFASGVTCAVLFAMLVRSVVTNRGLIDADGATPALEIEVTAKQWWWAVRYVDEAHPSQTFSTANEIHIPVGQPVRFKLRSTDVIHSFWVPRLHGKRDMIPSRDTTLTLQADEPGVYRGQCAEFCGLAHAKMALLVIAESPDDFAAWQAHQRQPAPTPSTPEQLRGQQLFLAGPCALCHAIGGTTAGSGSGPDLTHLAGRTTLAAASFPNVRGHLAGWILNSQSLKPGNQMPNVSLSPTDLQDLLAYLETLR